MQPFVEEGHVLHGFFPDIAYLLVPLVSAGVLLVASALAYVGVLLLSS